MATHLKVISHNVQGFNSPHKRSKAFTFYKSTHADIVCIQETHFSQSSNPKYLSRHFPNFYCSSGPNKTKGVLVAFRKNLPLTISQQIRDDQGRYLILIGELFDSQITLVTYYAPNTQQNIFFEQLLQKIIDHHSGPIILAGDSNMVLDTYWDKSHPITPHSQIITESPSRLKKMLLRLNLIDSWRELHPHAKEYTHYSNPHGTYSRIDHIFVSQILIPNAHQAHILTVPWSDHSPITLTLTSLWQRPTEFSWRLNDSLLKIKTTFTPIKQAVENYFRENQGSVSSPTTLWEAHKTVIRGEIIRISSTKKKQATETIKKLEQQLHDTTRQDQSSPSPTLKATIRRLRTDLDFLLSQATEKQLQWTKQRFYTQSNKIGTLLARKLNQPAYHTPPPTTIRTRTGDLTSNPQKILEEFSVYYSALYTKTKPFPSSIANKLFSTLQLPKLSTSQSESLDAYITAE
uniref:exodeoxyribonuclease III n=1 Tax=Xenopus tropicalis TaxID=8364 RepID=A0A803JHJ3_XENTR